MFGGVGKAGWASILVAGGLVLGTSVSATAADLGGDCCADLEERVAELEATAARKGNRKVSLQIYGQVNEALGWWNDGQESNVYQFTNDTSRTRIGFKGKAKITSDLYAAYRIEIGWRSNDQGALSASTSKGGVGPDIRHAYWTIGSKTYGEISVGEQSMAHDGITQMQTARIGHFANPDIFDANDSFRVVGTNRTWDELSQVFEPGEGSRASSIRYKSPEFGGFQLSSHWGEDDIWGVALTYDGKFKDFVIEAGIGYGEISLRDEECTETASGTASCQEWGGSLSVMHNQSGLFATAAYGMRKDEVRGAINGGDDDIWFYHVQAGIERKWIALGETTFFGGYQHRDSGAVVAPNGGARITVNGNDVTGSEFDMWELGLNQHVKAAAMDFYLHYKHYEVDATTTAGHVATEPWQTVIGGAMIKF